MGVTSRQRGRHLFGSVSSGVKTVYAGDGTMALVEGLHAITKTGSAAALTLPVPTGLPDGFRIRVRSQTAFAHVVTVTGGFGGTGGTRDVATFTAEVGAGFTAEVVNALWHLESTNLVAVA